MKIGDKVRFLSETGGGVVAGFKGKDVVLVEDEDGFQIPTPVSDVVVITTEDYSMKRMVGSGKQNAGQEQNAKNGMEEEERSSVRSVKSLLGDTGSFEEADDDPSDRPITYHKKQELKQLGNKLTVSIAFVPGDITKLDSTPFDAYIVNESGYNIHYLIVAREEQAWRFVAQGNLSPDSQKLITTVPHDSLNALDVVAVQLSAWKEEGLFLLKPAVDARLRIDPLRLMKTGAYAESPRFQTSVLSYSIVKDDVVARPVVVDRDNLKADMYHKDSVKVTKKENHETKRDDGTIVIDLHADELLDTTEGMDAADILQYQMDTFNRIMKENIKNTGQKIIFIHGKGAGVLHAAIIHELGYRYKHCRWQDASFQQYGYGATQVTIR